MPARTLMPVGGAGPAAGCDCDNNCGGFTGAIIWSAGPPGKDTDVCAPISNAAPAAGPNDDSIVSCPAPRGLDRLFCIAVAPQQISNFRFSVSAIRFDSGSRTRYGNPPSRFESRVVDAARTRLSPDDLCKCTSYVTTKVGSGVAALGQAAAIEMAVIVIRNQGWN